MSITNCLSLGVQQGTKAFYHDYDMGGDTVRWCQGLAGAAMAFLVVAVAVVAKVGSW